MKRILKEALGNDVNDDKFLVISVLHVVILEVGFIQLDSISAMATCCSHLIDELSSSTSIISLRYTLVEILIGDDGD